jgi:hypothetical protein
LYRSEVLMRAAHRKRFSAAAIGWVDAASEADFWRATKKKSGQARSFLLKNQALNWSAPGRSGFLDRLASEWQCTNTLASQVGNSVGQ